ncbi:MAG TPA: maltose alpha-D-glucosyltransferase [Thermomicrobiaceae bacterium]|nr:maltose alpha-D-glucosyltransferase [Thermomicrobiaceae bacterium]
MTSNRAVDDALESEPTWYKDAIFYEVHVRAFYDSDGDGIGDFRGLIKKLDYIQDLGATTIWVLPFYPSPLRDDGYDISDYRNVHPAYGTRRDVRQFVREAHKRGLRVVTELVCNHTSDEHPWFQRARRARPGSVARDFYVWSDNPEKYHDARVIFKDFEPSNWSWDPVANAYYWHRFYAHQPDLNFDNPRVRQAIFKVLDFWLEMGIDGLRLDAIPYLFEREGTNCENLPETHEFLKELRAHVDAHYDSRMLLAEANQWPEDAVAYFGNGDECHMCFHFPLMPRMFMSIRMEDRFPIVDILAQTPAIPDVNQWALFLRNHDELTLEMVTDDERDYMYRVYAHETQMRINQGIRRRLAPLLNNNRRRIELMYGLLFSLPGTPVIYYGDEIGMGDNIYLGDRNGVRTPMQWAPDRNAGFSEASRQKLFLPVVVDAEYHYEAVNVEAQQNNPHSLLWWMKRLIDLRKRHQALGRGSLELLFPDNRKVLAFVRRYGDETILVVANLSRFVQAAEIDLSEFQGQMPVELFGRVEFPPIGELPYFITLGPHSFYWFALQPQQAALDSQSANGAHTTIPVMHVRRSWEEVVRAGSGTNQGKLAEILPGYLVTKRWFGAKSRRIKGTRIIDLVPLQYEATEATIILCQLDFTDGDAENYLVVATVDEGAAGDSILQEAPQSVIAIIDSPAGKRWVLHDALVDVGFGHALLGLITSRRRIRGQSGEITGSPYWPLRQILSGPPASFDVAVGRAEQSNTSIRYGDRLILKLIRRLEPGVNPDVEVTRFLTKRQFIHTPPFAGSIEYRPASGEPMTCGILQGFVPNEGDAWSHTLEALSRFFENARAESLAPPLLGISTANLLTLVDNAGDPAGVETLNGYLSEAFLLGQRTAEMHLELSHAADDPAFTPETLTSFGQRSIYQSIRAQLSQVLQSLEKRVSRLPASSSEQARMLLQQRERLQDSVRAVIDHRIQTMLTRIHGDYHLGQVLYTGSDFMIIDFEGEPRRSLSERRRKRSPLQDVAGMLRSFHYASASALLTGIEQGTVRDADQPALEAAARFWHQWVSAYFLRGYLETAGNSPFVPGERRDLAILLDAFRLEKAIYEIGYELDNRPNWLAIPLRGTIDLLRTEVAAAPGSGE